MPAQEQAEFILEAAPCSKASRAKFFNPLRLQSQAPLPYYHLHFNDGFPTGAKRTGMAGVVASECLLDMKLSSFDGFDFAFDH